MASTPLASTLLPFITGDESLPQAHPDGEHDFEGLTFDLSAMASGLLDEGPSSQDIPRIHTPAPSQDRGQSLGASLSILSAALLTWLTRNPSHSHPSTLTRRRPIVGCVSLDSHRCFANSTREPYTKRSPEEGSISSYRYRVSRQETTN